MNPVVALCCGYARRGILKDATCRGIEPLHCVPFWETRVSLAKALPSQAVERHLEERLPSVQGEALPQVPCVEAFAEEDVDELPRDSPGRALPGQRAHHSSGGVIQGTLEVGFIISAERLQVQRADKGPPGIHKSGRALPASRG